MNLRLRFLEEDSKKNRIKFDSQNQENDGLNTDKGYFKFFKDFF